VDAALNAALLDDAFDRLVPQLAAGQEDVRLAAVAVLKNTVHDCMGGGVGRQHEGAFASLEAALGPTHQEIWVPVLSGTPVLPPVIWSIMDVYVQCTRLGVICLGFRFHAPLTAILRQNVTICMGNNSCIANFALRLIGDSPLNGTA